VYAVTGAGVLGKLVPVILWCGTENYRIGREGILHSVGKMKKHRRVLAVVKEKGGAD